MDAHAVVRPDAVDGFQFGAAVRLVLQLVVGTAGEHHPLHLRSLEGTSRNWNHETVAMLRLPDREARVAGNMQFNDEFQSGRFRNGRTLCHQGVCAQQNSRKDEKQFLHIV